MKLASLLFLQQMELAMCEAGFFCNWRLNILSWISILQVQHIGYMHSWKQKYAKASLNPSFPSFWTGHWRVWGRVYIFKTSFFKLIADNLVETSYLKVHLELIVQTGFSKEKCLPWLKIHPLDVLIDRSQKVTQTASRNNMCKQRLLALPITSPKPGSQAVSIHWYKFTFSLPSMDLPLTSHLKRHNLPLGPTALQRDRKSVV